VGERLRAPLRLVVAAPLDVVPRALTPCTTVAFVLGALVNPGRSRGQEGEGWQGYSPLPASGDRAPAHLSPTPFQRRGCGPLSDLFRSSWSLHRCSSTSDVSLSLLGTPESASVPPDALPVLPRVDGTHCRLTFESRALRRAAGKSNTGRNPRTPSVVS
jgi:hypothetical protein